MGNCMGSDEVKGYHSYYHNDVEIAEKEEIYKPVTTSLFNTLRKTADCVVVAGSNALISSETVDILRIDFENATPSNLKTLLNFKKIVYIGSAENEGEGHIKKIKAHVSYTKFYVVSESIFKTFMQDFPIFSKANWLKLEMVTNKLPLMIIDSKQFVHSTEQRLKLFIHTVSKKNLGIYRLMGITSEEMVINEPSSKGSTEHVKSYYVNALKNMKHNAAVLLHNATLNSTDILDIVCTFLLEKYKVPVHYSQIYLKKSLPNTITSHNQISNGDHENETVPKTSSVIVTGIEKYAQLFQKLQEESNEQKVERAYNLLSTLIINIYSNPNNEESYRQVKRTNRQINDLLIKYKNGLKLLDELGFRQKDEFWVNTVESKYLKIYKTDFDLGFKRYKTHDVDK